MIVTRAHHAYEGQSLAVHGRVHRHDRAHLLLVLPDGSRSLIPAAWTNLQPDEQVAVAGATPPIATLALLSDLLQARSIVDALLCRLPALGEEAIEQTGKERQRAATKSDRSGERKPREPRLGTDGQGTTGVRRRNIGATDRASSHLATTGGTKS